MEFDFVNGSKIFSWTDFHFQLAGTFVPRGDISLNEVIQPGPAVTPAATVTFSPIPPPPPPRAGPIGLDLLFNNPVKFHEFVTTTNLQVFQERGIIVNAPHYFVVNATVGAPPPKPNLLSRGQSVTYDASQSTLSFSNDFVTTTGYPDEPLLGAVVSPPPLTLDRESTNGSVFRFEPSIPGETLFTIHSGSDVFLKANLDTLTYLVSSNNFRADLSVTSLAGVSSDSPFFDPSLPVISSPFLEGVEAFLDPDSPFFSPSDKLSLSYIPSDDFFGATHGFTISAESPVLNVVSIPEVPEPSSLLLLASGVAGLFGLGSWRGKRFKTRTLSLHRARRT